jgi:EpsI family protein
MLTVPVLLLEIWVLKKIGKRNFVNGPDVQPLPITLPGKELEYKWKSLRQPVFLVVLIIIAATFTISRTVEFREKIPINKSFAGFPQKIGEWQGTRLTMEQQFIDVLHFSDYIMMNYRNSKGQDIDFYVAYYESQRRGETTHSPETCLPGSGWTFEQSGTAEISLGDGKIMETNRAFIGKIGVKQLTYFWFSQRDRILTSLVQVKLYSFWDALTKHRTDGALVRIITPVYQNENIEDAEARLQGFTKQVVPVLNQFLPQ